MPREPEQLDPYAPPPRYKEKSGGIVRVALIAAMLGLGVWGYTQFNDPNAPALVAEEQTQQVADNGAMPENGYAVTPMPDAAPAAPADTSAQSAAPTRAAPAAPAADPVPPPSTTIGAPPAG